MAPAHKTNIDGLKAGINTGAINFWSGFRPIKCPNHNIQSILFRLTGQSFDKYPENNQIMKAKVALEKALLVERRKAKMKRFDYDLNRHIALHQANKELDEIQDQISKGRARFHRK